MAGMNWTPFPKYTTLMAAAGTARVYPSEAFDVTPYGASDITVNPVDGTATGTYSAQPEESSDLNTWNPIGSPTTLTPGTPVKIGVTHTERYVRLGISVGAAGTDAVLTLWARAVSRDTH